MCKIAKIERSIDLLNIGMVLIDVDDEKESMSVAKKVFPFLKKIGRSSYGTTFEIISLKSDLVEMDDKVQLTVEGHQKLKELDGFIFMVPTFSGDVPEDYCALFQDMSNELTNKSALVICYGAEKDRKNTKRKINEVLLNYDIGLPTSDIFLPEYDFVEWKLKSVIEDYITSRVKEFIFWTMSMKYLRNLKKSLVM